MTIYVLTLFPEFFQTLAKHSIIKRAISKKILKLKFINLRDFAKDSRKTVDDTPYGGGAGMVMKVDVIHKALKSIKPKPYTILLSPSGETYAQTTAKSLTKHKSIALICGHYEGADARIEKYVDRIISIGDYVLTGGEIPAMIIIDTVARLIPNVISPNSPQNESFENNLLEYPQYTRPEIYDQQKVPKILLSGNHKKIESWRKQKSQERTKIFRQDLLKRSK